MHGVEDTCWNQCKGKGVIITGSIFVLEKLIGKRIGIPKNIQGVLWLNMHDIE